MDLHAFDSPFRPYLVAADDGRRLVLEQTRSASDRALRVMMYALLLLVLGLFALIPYGLWMRPTRLAGYVVVAVTIPVLWLLLRVLVLTIRAEGVYRIVVEPGVLTRDTRGVVVPGRERIGEILAVEACPRTVSTRYGAVRWLDLRARRAGDLVELTALHLDRDREPGREAEARRAAALLAERLGVPLEVHDEAAPA